jgi:hypothetical protein
LPRKQSFFIIASTQNSGLFKIAHFRMLVDNESSIQSGSHVCCLPTSIPLSVTTQSSRRIRIWVTEEAREGTALHELYDLFGNRAEGQRMPSRDAVREDYDHVNMVALTTSMMFPPRRWFLALSDHCKGKG